MRNVSEALLFTGYGISIRRTERCACGGSLTAEEGRVAEAVMAYNRTPKHEAWRAWREVGR